MAVIRVMDFMIFMFFKKISVTFDIVGFCMCVGGCDGKQFEPFSVRTFRAAKFSFELHGKQVEKRSSAAVLQWHTGLGMWTLSENF